MKIGRAYAHLLCFTPPCACAREIYAATPPAQSRQGTHVNARVDAGSVNPTELDNDAAYVARVPKRGDRSNAADETHIRFPAAAVQSIPYSIARGCFTRQTRPVVDAISGPYGSFARRSSIPPYAGHQPLSDGRCGSHPAYWRPARTGYCPPSKRIFGQLNYSRWKMRAHLFSTSNIQNSAFPPPQRRVQELTGPTSSGTPINEQTGPGCQPGFVGPPGAVAPKDSRQKELYNVEK